MNEFGNLSTFLKKQDGTVTTNKMSHYGNKKNLAD
jgi:hypothetical protein